MKIEIDYAREYTTMEMPMEIKYKGLGYQLELGLDGIDNLKVGLSLEQLKSLGQAIRECLEG